jgi:hypothetical protein
MLRAALLAASGAILLAACEPAPEPADTPPQQPPAGDTAPDPAAPAPTDATDPGQQPADPVTQPPADPTADPAAPGAMDMAEDCAAEEYRQYVGADVSEIDADALPEPNRVYQLGDSVTMDHRPDRLNIITDENDMIVEVMCG